MTELMAETFHDAGGGSRRTFMVGVAGLTAGAAALATVQASGTVGSFAPAGDVLDEGAAATGALVAYVKDLAAGEIAVMRGDTEVVVVDHELARALARLVG